MRLTATPQGQGRPEEVAGALGLRATRVHRLALGLAPPDAEPEVGPRSGAPRGGALGLRRPPDPLPQVPAVGHLLGPPRRAAQRGPVEPGQLPLPLLRQAPGHGKGRQGPRRRFLPTGSACPAPAPYPPVCATKPALPCPGGPRRQARDSASGSPSRPRAARARPSRLRAVS